MHHMMEVLVDDRCLTLPTIAEVSVSVVGIARSFSERRRQGGIRGGYPHDTKFFDIF